MKNKKIQYIIYLLVVHLVCMFLTISRFIFPTWGKWIDTTKFLSYSIPIYAVMIILVFPFLTVAPYCIQNQFPNVPLKKKFILSSLLIGNILLILAYTIMINKMYKQF